MPKTIEDIIPPSRRRAMMGDVVPEPTTAPNTPPPPVEPPTPPAMPPQNIPPQRVRIKTGSGFPYGTAIIAVIVIAVCAGVLYAFADAKVEITPASKVADVSGDFTATKVNGDLPFTVISVQKNASVAVPAESTQSSNDSAQGTIVISNAQKTPQALITNTRFAAADGHIFRIHAPISIPAGGTLSVTVYADQPGAAYNIGATTFTVPGLQNSPAFALVTAKSNAPMAGGFTGTRASVSQATSDKQHIALQASLASDLKTALAQKIPAGSVLVPGATFTSYQALPDSASTTKEVYVSEQGTMNAVVFPQEALAKAIAYKSVGTYAGEPVTLSNVSKLSLAPTNPTEDPSSVDTFTFTLSGSTTIVWKVDSQKIAAAVAGKTRDSAQSILQGFPEVDQAILILRPFWTSTFPQDPAHVKVTVDQVKSGN